MSWLTNQNPDFICLQEIKAQENDLEKKHLNLEIEDVNYTFSLCAKKRGYSGGWNIQ